MAEKRPKKLTFTIRELSKIKWVLETWKETPPSPGKRRRKTTVACIAEIINKIDAHLQECNESKEA